jgi:anti-sigma factor RsiW
MRHGKHVSEVLSAFHHGELPAGAARAVEVHLEGCGRCRTASAEIRFAIEAAGHLTRVEAPATLWDGIRARLDARDDGAAPRLERPARASFTALRYAAAGVVLVAAGFAAWFFGFRERLELVRATAAPLAFERAAQEMHLRRLEGALALAFVGDSPARLRDWVRREAGFDLALAIDRPAEDTGRFRPLGATIVRAGGARAALVAYEVDGHPVTLLSAPLKDVEDPPAAFGYKKRVTCRLDAGAGLKVLTWGADGQAYVLVSDLPALGTDACSICHTSPERRRLILDAHPRAGT